VVVREFGCDGCYPEAAPGAWHEYIRSFETVANLVEDSHWVVSVWRCTTCKQRFVYVWTEFVDWEGGNDPTYRTVIPVDDKEAAAITKRGGDVDTDYLGALGKDRRHLIYDIPLRADPRFMWREGPLVVTPGY
jgi:hypothetical protein